jgi:hypothetical protein
MFGAAEHDLERTRRFMMIKGLRGGLIWSGWYTMAEDWTSHLLYQDLGGYGGSGWCDGFVSSVVPEIPTTHVMDMSGAMDLTTSTTAISDEITTMERHLNLMTLFLLARGGNPR